MIDFKGWFELIDKNGKVLRKVSNHLINGGARYILSHLRGQLPADGYGSSSALPSYIHCGRDSTPWAATQWSVNLITTPIAISGSTLVSPTQLRFTAPISGMSVLIGRAIGELAIGLTVSSPSSATDYINALIDRAPLIPAFTPAGAMTITYNMEIVLQ